MVFNTDNLVATNLLDKYLGVLNEKPVRTGESVVNWSTIEVQILKDVNPSVLVSDVVKNASWCEVISAIDDPVDEKG